jgi:hypothetical protein
MVPPLVSRGLHCSKARCGGRSLAGWRDVMQFEYWVVLRMGFRKHLIFEIWFLISPACICQIPALTNVPDAGQ